MTEEIIEESEETKKKMNSRKFIVWVVWALLTIAVLVIGTIVMLVTKSYPETITDLIELVLGFFFYISLVYLGVNGIQKVGFAISDAISVKDKK